MNPQYRWCLHVRIYILHVIACRSLLSLDISFPLTSMVCSFMLHTWDLNVQFRQVRVAVGVLHWWRGCLSDKILNWRTQCPRLCTIPKKSKRAVAYIPAYVYPYQTTWSLSQSSLLALASAHWCFFPPSWSPFKIAFFIAKPQGGECGDLETLCLNEIYNSKIVISSI